MKWFQKLKEDFDESENVNQMSEKETIDISDSSSEEEGEIGDSDDNSVISDDSQDFHVIEGLL